MTRSKTLGAALTGVAAVAILFSILAKAEPGDTSAQTATPGVTEHPLVGSWLFTDGDTTFEGVLFSFNADGIALASWPDGGTAHGSWSMAGDRSSSFTIVGTSTDRAGQFAEIETFRGSFEINASGDAWQGTYMVERIAPGQTAAFSASPLAHIGAARITDEEGAGFVATSRGSEPEATPAP